MSCAPPPDDDIMDGDGDWETDAGPCLDDFV